MNSRRCRTFLVFVVVSFSVVFAAHAGPSVIVNSPFDAHDANPDGICLTAGGVCTLRAAIEDGGGLPIVLPAGTYSLTLGELQTNTLPVTITGAGMDSTIITAGSLSRVILVYSNAITLRNLTLRDGNVSGAGGGAIAFPGLDQGAGIVLDSVRLTNNVASVGGAVFCNDCGGVSATDSVIENNQATDVNGDGAGIWMNITYVNSAPMQLTRTTVSGNIATRNGGGIWGLNADMTLTNSTISGNLAKGSGGGIYENSGTLHLYNATITKNTSDIIGGGGGILTSATLATDATLSNTILAGNREVDTFQHILYQGDCNGTFNATANSIVGYLDPTYCTVAGSYILTDPNLGQLQNNGGLTPTHALLTGSAAIDGGDPIGCATGLGTALATDQRGVHRPIGARCDIGAYERNPCGDANGDGVVNGMDVVYLVNYLYSAGLTPDGFSDVNGDGSLDPEDVFVLLNFIFADGPAPVCSGT